MQLVHTRMRFGAPFTSAFTACRFTFQRRRDTLCACEMLLPNCGPLPQTSHTCAMLQTPEIRWTFVPPWPFLAPTFRLRNFAGRTNALPTGLPNLQYSVNTALRQGEGSGPVGITVGVRAWIGRILSLLVELDQSQAFQLGLSALVSRVHQIYVTHRQQR